MVPGSPYRAWRTLPWKLFAIRTSATKIGLGVYTTTFIPKYTWIGEYEGDVLNQAQSRNVQDFEYTWRVCSFGSINQLF